MNDVTEVAKQFWESYRLLVAEAVFFGTLAAHGLMALLRWVRDRLDF